jgi:uncharacterized delta-60 repeat protein
LAPLLVGVLLIAAGSAQAAPGALDPSFGTGGTVTTAIGSDSVADGVALQRDGKIIAVGNSATGTTLLSALARYNADGSLDPSFGAGGRVTTAFGIGESRAEAVALQPDGKIVVIGFVRPSVAKYSFALARYNPDGSPDPSFGAGGKVTTAIQSDDEAYAVALEPNGKIVVGGESSDYLTREFALVRYNPDGSLDTGFGAGGKVTTPIGSGGGARGLALQPDGEIVVVGYCGVGSQSAFAVARYNGNGTLDPSFGTGGKVTTAIGSTDDEASAIALQPDGEIVAAGYSDNGLHKVFALVRYDRDGSLDPSFGSGGTVTTKIGPGGARITGVALQPDGKIVAAGWDDDLTSHGTFMLARYNPDGSLDPGFGTAGEAATAVESGDSGALGGLALQPDGRIVAAGYTFNGPDTEFALVRYLGNTQTVAVGGSGGGTVSSSPTGSSAPSVTLTATQLCVVPRLKGKTLAAARRAVKRAHCSVGRITRAFSSKLAPRRVISQWPVSGKALPENSQVRLTVSHGRLRHG